MTDLAEFLLTRIAEDEAAAKARDLTRPIHFVGCYYYEWTLDANLYCDCDEDGAASRRLLAECEAKRRIVAWHRLVDGLDIDDNPVRGCGNCIASGAVAPYIVAGPCMTLRLLALPHADFREEWRL